MGADAAPVRNLLRAREEVLGLVVQILLTVGFLVALVLFSRSVARLFERHGAHLNPWYLRVSLAAIVAVMVLTARRIWHKSRELLAVRREIRELDAQVQQLRAGGQRKE